MADPRIRELLRELRERYHLDLIERPDEGVLAALREVARCGADRPEQTRRVIARWVERLDGLTKEPVSGERCMKVSSSWGGERCWRAKGHAGGCSPAGPD